MSIEDKKPESQNVDIPRNLDFVEQYGKHELRQTNIEGDLLKFIKGVWFAGPDKKVVELGTRMIVNCDSMQLGWQRWEDEKPIDFVMGKIVETFQPPKREALSDPPGPNGKNPNWPLDDNGNLSDPWQYTVQVLMKDENGELYTYSASSKGGRSALGQLMLAWSRKIRDSGDDAYPIITLGSDVYKHKRYGLIDFPVLEVVDWVPVKDWDDGIKPAPKPSKAEVAKAAPKGRRDLAYDEAE